MKLKYSKHEVVCPGCGKKHPALLMCGRASIFGELFAKSGLPQYCEK